MIKLGCNAMLRNPENPDQWLDVDPLIDFIHELKFDMIDFQFDRGFPAHTPDELLRIKLKCQHDGLPIGNIGIGSGFVGSVETDQGVLGASLPPEEMQRRIDEVKAAVDAAAFLSAPLIRLFAGAIPEGSENREALQSTMVQSFQEVADYAIEQGILIGLHNHPPAAEPTGDDILNLWHQIDRKNVTIILDTGRWQGSPGTNREGKFDPSLKFYAYMEQVAPHAAYVRAKIYKIDSGQEEWLDYSRIMAILKAANFNGNMSIVFEDRNNQCDAFESIRLASRYLRRLLDEM